MNAIRKGLRLGGQEEEPRRESNSGLPRPQTSAFQAPLVAPGLEPETTIKTKLISAWNNVKYGKKAWATSEIFKTGFSNNSPVWLLGQAYHRKLVSSMEGSAGSPTGNTVRTFTETDCGIEEFEKDFQSRIWLTYRRGFPEMGSSGVTSDCGWGCMLRSGQMMLAQALVLHWLGRDWRLTSSSGLDLDPGERWQSERLYRAIIAVFADSSDSRVAPLSLHNMVRLGQGSGKGPGDWFGPHTVAHLLVGAARSAEQGSGSGLLDSVAVYVAQDCTVYTGDVERLCGEMRGAGEETGDFSVVEIPGAEAASTDNLHASDVNIDGETWCLERRISPPRLSEPETAWKSVIIMIPVRLGSEVFNPMYSSCIKNLLTLECCIGIIGGKPKHSLYFIGFQDDDLIHLDPHRLQDKVDTLTPDFPTESYHCRNPRKISLARLDPSCCLGFYLRTEEEWRAWRETITPMVTPPAMAGVRAEYPMFVVTEGCSSDARPPQDWVSLGPDSVLPSSASLPSHTETEDTEKFVFL